MDSQEDRAMVNRTIFLLYCSIMLHYLHQANQPQTINKLFFPFTIYSNPNFSQLIDIIINAGTSHSPFPALFEPTAASPGQRSYRALSFLVNARPSSTLRQEQIRNPNGEDQDQLWYFPHHSGYAFLEVEPFPRAKIMKTCYHILEQLSKGFPETCVYRIYN